MKKIKKTMKRKGRHTDRPVTAFEKWLSKTTNVLLDLYDLGNVSVYAHERKVSGNSKHVDATVIFKINCSTTYKTANIWYYPETVDLFKNKQYTALTHAITHEVAHIMTDPITKLADMRFATSREIEDANENLTESIAQLGRKIIKAKGIELFKKGKKK